VLQILQLGLPASFRTSGVCDVVDHHFLQHCMSVQQELLASHGRDAGTHVIEDREGEYLVESTQLPPAPS
jgi:hypothetical protein